VRTVRPNDINDLTRAFEQAEQDNLHVEMMALEPVAGEGNPGVHLTAEFYEACRALTIKYHSLLLVDSVQAGLRTRGNLSVMDSDACHHSHAPGMCVCVCVCACLNPFIYLTVNALCPLFT
jgi:acetylornithine/succinyldiaminopimelate/putrescine aminotransferase